MLTYLCVSLLQKIDYVLVYSEPELGKENDEEEKEKAEMREKYEENLRKQGLMVEHVTSDEQVCEPDNLVLEVVVLHVSSLTLNMLLQGWQTWYFILATLNRLSVLE